MLNDYKQFIGRIDYININQLDSGIIVFLLFIQHPIEYSGPRYEEHYFIASKEHTKGFELLTGDYALNMGNLTKVTARLPRTFCVDEDGRVRWDYTAVEIERPNDDEIEEYEAIEDW